MNARLTISALILPFLAGCVSPDASADEGEASDTNSQKSAVALGQTLDLGAVSVTPLEVTEDSRCPANARCVWAGQLIVRVKILHGTNTQDRGITANKPISVGAGMLELTEAVPLAMTGPAIAPEDYRLTFSYAPHIMDGPQNRVN